MSQSIRIAAVAIGDELLDGKLVDQNIAMATAACSHGGALVVETRTVRDDRAAVSRALVELAAISDVVICSGGLGPTTDDRTRAAFAEATSAPLERRANVVERLTEKMRRRGRALTDTQLRQADFPAGATVLGNEWGTADAFEVRIGEARVFALPGVPHEFDAHFARDVLPICSGGRRETVTRWAVVGIGEGDVGQRVESIDVPANHSLRYLANSPLVLVELASRDAIDETVADAIERSLSPWRLSPPSADLASSLIAALRGAGPGAARTLGAIESCTGGLIGHLVSEVAGASTVWMGSVVAYTAKAKHEIVGVSDALLRRSGTIHPETTVALAERGRERLGSDLCIGVTGVAGPGPHEGQPPGTVFVAVASAEETVLAHACFAGLHRSAVKQRAAALALRLATLSLMHELDYASAYFGVTKIERLAPGSLP